MTKRSDLVEQREAGKRFGLGDDAFLVSQYLPAVKLSELSDEQMQEAVEMAELGAFERAIARVLGVDEGSFMSALSQGRLGKSERYAEWASRFYEARKKHMKRNLRRINESVEEGDWKPAAWQLERSFGFHKQEHVEHEVGPQTLSLMAVAQIPLGEAREALEVEGELVGEE